RQCQSSFLVTEKEAVCILGEIIKVDCSLESLLFGFCRECEFTLAQLTRINTFLSPPSYSFPTFAQLPGTQRSLSLSLIRALCLCCSFSP
ncbi:unnamed protein product, partial [Prunus brigantina]